MKEMCAIKYSDRVGCRDRHCSDNNICGTEAGYKGSEILGLLQNLKIKTFATSQEENSENGS